MLICCTRGVPNRSIISGRKREGAYRSIDSYREPRELSVAWEVYDTSGPSSIFLSHSLWIRLRLRISFEISSQTGQHPYKIICPTCLPKVRISCVHTHTRLHSVKVANSPNSRRLDCHFARQWSSFYPKINFI